MKQKLRKIVIPVAGYGTRFLPFTKAMPKEMIPIVDTPVIQKIVEAAVQSGIEEVILITGSNKRAIEDHFDFNLELEYRLKEAGKDEQYKEMRRIASMAQFIYVRQKEPLGNGHAILQAAPLVRNEPFVVTWGDEFFENDPPLVKQLIDTYDEYQKPVISLVRSTKENHEDFCSKYGCVAASEVKPNTYHLTDIIEKPEISQAPSDLFSVGGYVLTPEVMEKLANTPPGKGGEIWLADALAATVKDGEMYGRVIAGKHYDCGSKMGFLKATIDFALKNPELAPELKRYLKDLSV
jgi:UTP--glucose-1-phosphate uridylyltransferase